MTDNASPYAIETTGLNKTYAGDANHAQTVALKDVNLKIPKGSFFGLLGPNGAGKSTFINILAGLVLKTSGEARIMGHDIIDDMRRARGAIGVVPQELNVDPFFTPREVLEVQAGLYGVPRSRRRTDQILAAVHLSAEANSYARALSGGMRRRLLVAKAMVHSPPVLVLDEPTAGVDVDLRRQLWDHILELNAKGTTILLTTHYLEEAEELCQEIAIINHGQVIACAPTGELVAQLDAKELTVTVDTDLGAVPEELVRFNAKIRERRNLVLRVPHGGARIEEILAAIHAAGLKINDLSTEETDLEDVFLMLTREGRDGTGAT